MTVSPYKFLASYGIDDRDEFFGRRLETDVLFSDIVVSRLVVLFAKTGTGKTSLINAGVRPRLHERGHETFFIRVRDEDPLVSARTVLRDLAPGKLPMSGTFPEQVRQLAQRLKRPVVLFFDQFEEFFLYTVAKQPGVADAFVNAIGELYDNSDWGIHVVFSMREEWFVNMGIFRERIPAIFHNDSNLQLRWFDRPQAQDAIVGPVGEGTYSRALVERLITELAETGTATATPRGGEIEPAQLQIVCDTLWRAAGDGKRPISVAAYKALGERGHRESVAQQILDRRLVQEFEGLQEPGELELLQLLLPELKTPEGTKRVRAYADLVKVLQAGAATPAPETSIRSLIEKLRDAHLVDIVPRESGELVELTHDYLVLRLDELQPNVRLIRPRRLVRDGLKAYQESGELLQASLVPEVLAHTNALRPDRAAGELILRSALGHLADVRSVLPVLEASGAPVWAIFAERIARGSDAERAAAIETLALVESPRAYSVLRKAFHTEDSAAQVIRLLGRAENPQSLRLLTDAIHRPRLRADARRALAELASSLRADIASDAASALRSSFKSELASRSSAPAAVKELVSLDSPVSIDLLAEIVSPSLVAAQAQAALSTLAASSHTAVAAKARDVLFARVERAVADGTAGRWCVDVLSPIEEPRTVQLLGRLAKEGGLGAEAEAALQALKDSTRPDVTAAAAKELDRLAGHVAPRKAPEPSLQRVGSAMTGDAVLDSHFQRVLQLLVNGRLIPFLGAGVNLIDRPPDALWKLGAPFSPSGREVAQYLAQKVSYPEFDNDDLIRVAQYGELVVGRQLLTTMLREIFDSVGEPTRLHSVLARLSRLLRRQGRASGLPIVITTTFDDLLERAFAAAAEPFDVVSYVAEGPEAGRFLHRRPDGRAVVIDVPNEYGELFGNGTVILKLHGSINRQNAENSSFVITEDDYIDYITRAAQPNRFLPAALASTLSSASYLFLGYSLRDWNLRVLVRQLWPESSYRERSWAILSSPSPVEIRLWERRNIDVLNVPLELYTSGLDEHLRSLDVSAVPA